ncbi:MAG: LysE family translocator [Pseudomonadota bacterium]
MPVDAPTLAAFAAACAVLIITPGPMVAYVVTTSLNKGLRPAFFAVLGAASASVVHLAVIALGLTTLLAVAGAAFVWLKWAGAIYLAYLGLRALTAPATTFNESAEASPALSRRVFAEAFLVNLTNPKALLFLGAFLPLFLAGDRPAGPQLGVLSATYLGVATVIDCLWALGADRARPAFNRLGRWMNRITGGVLLLAAAGLASANKSG